MQQDAHEFLNYLLNTIADLLQEEKSQERQQNGTLVHNGGCDGREEGRKETQQTWVHEIFQGTLTNETRCLNCEAVSQLFISAKMHSHNHNMHISASTGHLRLWLQVSSKDEDFLDLSVDVEQNTSITHCLR